MTEDKPTIPEAELLRGREEKAGPGPIIKPQVQILLEEVHTFLRQAAARHDRPSSKKAEELRANVGNLLGAMKQKRVSDQQVFAEWKPTEANIKALPAPIRAHIEDCEKLIKENEAVREFLSNQMTALLHQIQVRADQIQIFQTAEKLKEFIDQ